MADMLRILMIEDCQADASLIVRELHRDGRTVQTALVSDAAGLEAQLADTPWPMFHHDARHTGQGYFAGPSILAFAWS